MCDRIKIGNRIKEARKELNITQELLGKSIGINKSTVQRYETGQIRNIKLPVIESMAKILCVRPEWITGHSNDKNIEIPNPAKADPDNFILYMYKRLDTEDKAEVRGVMKQMLKSDKYEQVIDFEKK